MQIIFLHQSQARTSVSKILKRQLILVASNHQTSAVGLTKRTLWPSSLIRKRFYQIAHPSYVEWNCQVHPDPMNTSGFLSLLSSFSTQCTENQTGTWSLFGDFSGKVKVNSTPFQVKAKVICFFKVT